MSNTDNNDVHGTSTVRPVGGGPAPTPPPPERKKGLGWLWPLLGALLLLGLLFLLLRSCGDREVEREAVTPAATTQSQTTTTTTTTPATGAAATTSALPVETVTLPGGQSFQAAPQTLNYELQRFLASSEAAPRRFTFDRLNFATNSADLTDPDSQQTVRTLAQILAAYPNARVRIEGYADARGSEPANDRLGALRADTVKRTLVAAGVPAARVETATGGEDNPVDTNATAAGQAENRRTDLVVLAK